MKKLFTILAAALFAGSIFAADEVLFSWTPKTGLSNADISAGTHTLPGEWLTSVTGGTAEMVVPSNGNMRIRNSQLAYNSNNSYFHITLNEALKADDQILINSSGNTNNLLFSLEATRPNDDTKAAEIVQGTTYTIGIGNALIGQTEFYVWRKSSTTQLGEFTISREKEEAADHTKATVKSISVNGTKLADFDPEKEEYDVELPYGTSEIPEVTAVAGDDATIVVKQATSVTGEATVTCTSYDEKTTIKYTLNFSVKEASHDATLKSITIGGVALADFAAETTEYEYVAEYDATEYPTIVVTANDANAIVMVSQPETFPGTVTIDVYAEDGETNKTYTITFTLETEIPIIRATHVDGTHANVKGSIGGTSEKSTQDNMKFGSNGHFWGITLAGDKTFQTGDSLVINLAAISTSNTNFIGLYAEQEGTTLLWNTGITAGVVGDNSVILPEALNGKASFYIVRPSNDNKWNGSIKSISVYRKDKGDPTAVENAEAAVKAVKVVENGQLVIIKNGVRYNAQGAVVK